VLIKVFKAIIVLYGSTTMSETLATPLSDDSLAVDPGYTEKLNNILLGYSCSSLLRRFELRPEPVPPPSEWVN